MKIYNICTKKSYEKNGETKTFWNTCGSLKELDNGKKFIELNMFPDTSFYVFEPKPKDGQSNAKSVSANDVNWTE